MAKPTLIAVNQTVGNISLDDLGGIVVPGSGQITLTANNDYSFSEIQESNDLFTEVTNDNILINDGSRLLSKAESLNYITTNSTVNDDGKYIKHNFAATDDPDANDDVTEGYSVGSYWINTTDARFFICLDSTDTAAVWKEVSLASQADLAALQISTSINIAIPTAGYPSAWGDIPFDTKDLENDSSVLEHDPSNNDRVLAKSSGLHLFIPSLAIDADSGEEIFQFRLTENDGGAAVTGSFFHLSEDDEVNGGTYAFVATLTAGKYYTLQAQASGAGNVIFADSKLTVMKLSGSKGEKGDTGSGSNIIVKGEDVTVSGGPHDTLDFHGFIVTDEGSGEVKIENTFSSGFQQASSEGESTTTSTTFQEKLKLTTASLAAGTYRIGWSLEITNSDDKKSTEYRIHLDDTTVLNQAFGPTKNNNNNYLAYSGFNYQSLSAAVHTIDIDFRAVDKTAKIRRARIEIWRIS